MILFGGLKSLLNRSQKVVVNDMVSKTIIVNTGVPQGTILSPLLFSLYTNEFKIHDSYFNLFKYADDVALVGWLSKARTEGETLYFSYINLFQNSCKLNITKDLLISKGLEPLILYGLQIEVGSLKYLGTFIDSKLIFADNVEYV